MSVETMSQKAQNSFRQCVNEGTLKSLYVAPNLYQSFKGLLKY